MVLKTFSKTCQIWKAIFPSQKAIFSSQKAILNEPDFATCFVGHMSCEHVTQRSKALKDSQFEKNRLEKTGMIVGSTGFGSKAEDV